MDELKLLIEMVANLPSLAVWVLVGYLVYKIAIVGSIYGVIRFCAGRLFDYLTTKKHREVEYKEVRPMLDGMCIKTETDRLIAQLHRLRGKGLTVDSNYIHSQSVDWLRDAIDKKIESERPACLKHYIAQAPQLSRLTLAFEHRAGLAVELGRLVGGLIRSQRGAS